MLQPPLLPIQIQGILQPPLLPPELQGMLLLDQEQPLARAPPDGPRPSPGDPGGTFPKLSTRNSIPAHPQVIQVGFSKSKHKKFSPRPSPGDPGWTFPNPSTRNPVPAHPQVIQAGFFPRLSHRLCSDLDKYIGCFIMKIFIFYFPAELLRHFNISKPLSIHGGRTNNLSRVLSSPRAARAELEMLFPNPELKRLRMKHRQGSAGAP